MLLLNSSDLLLEALLADRRREVSALSRSNFPRRRSVDLRGAVAGALAHIALHIDRRSLELVAAHHPRAAGRR